MPLTEDPNTGVFTIDSYTPGQIRINNTTYTQSLILTPNRLIENWGIQNCAALTAQDLIVIAQENPEVVLLGTGVQQQFPSTAVLAELIQKNIGYEIMDTAAACRTYNLLIAEGRNVVAGLIL